MRGANNELDYSYFIVGGLRLVCNLTCYSGQAIIPTVNTTKQDVLKELQSARATLREAFNGLSPEQMRMPGASGVWSVKDVLAHIAAWESELVTALNQVLNGRVPAILDIEDIDEWNEEQYHISVQRPLQAVLDDLEGVHKMLLEMANDVDERMLTDNRMFPWMEGEPLWYLIAENGYLHEREHTEDIQAWRKEMGL